MEIKNFRVKGVIAAPPTAYTETGEVLLETIDQQAKLIKESGLTGVFTTGTTGDHPSLTIDERKSITAAWAKVAKRYGLVQIAHIGHTSVEAARELARHAAEVKVDAIAAAPPYYYKITHYQHLVDVLAHIASAAPETPFYYYHIPSQTHVDLSMTEMLKHLDETGKIPNFRGMKYTDTNLREIFELGKYGNRKYNILVGGDDMLLAGLCSGGDGSIGIGYNIPYLGRIATTLAARFYENDLAKAMICQQVLMNAQGILKHYPDGALKVAMAMSGLRLGPERLPKIGLDEATAKKLMAELADAGICD